jgi:hypothetical protein
MDAHLDPAITPDPQVYINGGPGVGGSAPDALNLTAMLIINSGSSASTDVPPPSTNASGVYIPIIMGEHSCLANRDGKPGNIFLYTGDNSIDVKNPVGGQYMKVIAPTHPIMQGIPLESQGRVKIFRDPYPEENSHVPPGGWPNYQYAWTTIDASSAAPGTTVIGLLDSNQTKAVFAVGDKGGINGLGITNASRLVHFWVNEQGSGNARRCFNNMTDLGKIIFIRTVKWAIGEPLTPYRGLGIIRVSRVAPQQIRIAWDGSSKYNYKLVGTADLSKASDLSQWQTIAQDITGVDGEVSTTLDISSAVQVAFLRVKQMP